MVGEHCASASAACSRPCKERRRARKRESCRYRCLTFARPEEARRRRRGRVQKGKERTFSAGLRAFGTGNWDGKYFLFSFILLLQFSVSLTFLPLPAAWLWGFQCVFLHEEMCGIVNPLFFSLSLSLSIRFHSWVLPQFIHSCIFMLLDAWWRMMQELKWFFSSMITDQGFLFKHVCMYYQKYKHMCHLHCYFSAFPWISRQQVGDFLNCNFRFVVLWVVLGQTFKTGQPASSLHLGDCHGYSESPALAEWHLLFNSYWLI